MIVDPGFKKTINMLTNHPSIFRCSAATICILVAALSGKVEADAPIFAEQRAALVTEVERYARFIDEDTVDSFSHAVLSAMASVQRHEFVPKDERAHAYENRPLPIGYGQTISQPYIVALMTELAQPDKEDVVLEIGTGSAYQAAVLAEIVNHVYTIEIIEPLAKQAEARLDRLGYHNVSTRLGDGYYGWEEHGPFDSILVTAAASHVPPPLIAQLRPGGRMVIPVGGRFTTQHLLLIEKTEQGEIKSRQILAVRFVPLTGEH